MWGRSATVGIQTNAVSAPAARNESATTPSGFGDRIATLPSGPPPVYVFPVPGGHFASPATQITFRGIPISQFGTITVTGSSSGAHDAQCGCDDLSAHL